MPQTFTLNVNGAQHTVTAEPDTPLLYLLRNDLGLFGAKFACGLEQCGACKVLLDGQAVPSCKLEVGQVGNLPVVTVEGLGSNGALHPLQQAFIEEQAIQCGFCVSGMIIAAQGLLNRQRYPTDQQIAEALQDNLCRCGVYDRVRRAIRLRIGRPERSAWQLRERPMPVSPAVRLPSSLLANPQLDDWVRINLDGTITLFTGKVEYGQGIKTAVAQIGADELDVNLKRIRVIMADTAQSPDEGSTVGSMSLETSGNAIRIAAAAARHQLLAVAFEELEVPLERLEIHDGTVFDPESGRSVDYWSLFGGRRFGLRLSESGAPKAATAYQVVGRPVQRLDLRDKVSGAACFVHDLALPDMVHGRVVRPPYEGAKLLSLDSSEASQLPGVLQVVRDGAFLGVIAQREEQAVRAMQALRESAIWQGQLERPTYQALPDYMAAQVDQAFLLEDGTPGDRSIPPIEAPAEATTTLNATFYRPYHMHASLGPSAAVAQLLDGRLTIWSHSQGAYPLRAVIAPVLGMDVDDIRVIHREGPGCYGHNGADDAALDAALLARAVPGVPVSLKWMREDEHRWEPYGPAMLIAMQGSLDAAGRVTDWNHDVYSYTHMGRARPSPHSSGLLAAGHLAQPWPRPKPQPIMGRHVGIHRNADPLYDFPRRRVVKHFLPDSPLRTSSMRGLGAYANVFAIESFMDEMAHAAGRDPIAFRLDHLRDERARTVIEAAAELADWRAARPGVRDGQGKGFAFSQYKNLQCYTAVVVELNVDRQSGQIRLQRVFIAADAGQIVNPDGLSNQLEGGFVQAASWTLHEEVRFDARELHSIDWDSYPILRFPEAPLIETVLLNRPGAPFMGSGEATQGPAPAAIANAIFDAIGLRLRRLPFTPDQVLSGIG